MTNTVLDQTPMSPADETPRVVRGHKPLIAAAASVLAAAIAIPIALTEGGHPARPSGIGSPGNEASYNGLTLRVPADWHAVQPTFVTGALFYPLGWITNADPGPQCTAGRHGHVSCHGPVTHLDSGVVQISVQTEGGNPDVTRHLVVNSRLAGLPAQRIDGTTRCQPSAVSGFFIVVADTRTSVIGLTACFGRNTSAQQRQVQQMLDSASFTHP